MSDVLDTELLGKLHSYANQVYDKEIALLKTLAAIPSPTGH